jgi:hypothetical protein
MGNGLGIFRLYTLQLCILAALTGCGSSLVFPRCDDSLAKPPGEFTTERFVSVTGEDSGNGSKATPWRTLQHALNEATPGSIIYLMPGTYHERVTVTRSGTENAYIKVTALEPGTVTMDGNEPPSQDDFAISRFAVFRIADVAYFSVEGLTITNDGKNYCSGACLGLAAFDIGRNAHHIFISGNDIHHIDRPQGFAGNYTVPILLASLEKDEEVIRHIVIQNNRFHDSDSNTENPEEGGFYSMALALSGNVEHVLIENNTFYDLGSGAVNVSGNYRSQVPTSSLSPSLDHPRKVVIRNNDFQRIANTYCIYIDGGRQTLIERNYLQNCAYGIGVVTEVIDNGADGYSEHIWIRNNIVNESLHFDFVAGMWLTASKRPNYDPVKNIYVTNNTFFSSKREPGQFSVQLRPGVFGDSKFANNIVVSNQQLLLRNSSEQYLNTVKLDFNIWNSEDSAPLCWDGSCGLFSSYQSTASQDAHGLFIVPGLVGPATEPNGFQLQSNAPAIDKGASSIPDWSSNFGDYTPSCECDYFGDVRVQGGVVDIGAGEKR